MKTNFYNKYILPRLLNFRMRKEDMEKERPEVASEAHGLVLEVGFGSGLNLPYYKNTEKLFALDPSRELYVLAQEKIKNISFPVEYLQVSAEEIPLPDNHVDCVVSTWSLCSIPHPEIALKEVFRVLKPSGKLSFIEHGKSPRKFFTKLQEFFTPISKHLTGGCHMDRDIEKLIDEAGFDIQKLSKFQQEYAPMTFMYKGVAVARK